jgi:hypothetical protein
MVKVVKEATGSESKSDQKKDKFFGIVDELSRKGKSKDQQSARKYV